MFCFFLRTGVLEVFKSIISLVIIAFYFFLWTCLSCSIISLKFILFCLFLGDCVQILYCFLYSAFCCLLYLQLFNWKFFDTFFRLESVQALLSIELLGVSQSGWTDLEYTKLCMMKHDTFHLYVLNRLFLSFLTNQDVQVQLMSIF